MILNEIVFWHWWILAVVLFVGEMATMTAYLLWIAIAAAITGIVKWLIPGLAWEWQWVIFALWSVLSVYIWWRRNKSLGPNTSTLNRRANQNIGKVLSLSTDIVNGKGKAQVGDSPWLVQCDQDLPKSRKVKVIDVENTVLIVAPFDENQG